MKGVIACLSLMVVALLIGFYSVVSRSVEVSALRRAEMASPVPLKARSTVLAGAKVALDRSARHDD